MDSESVLLSSERQSMDETTADERRTRNRRSVLRSIAGGAAVLGGVGVGAGSASASGPSRAIKTLETLGGNTTKLHVLEADKPGPTALVTAGIQGGEPAGIRTAERLTSANVKAGTLAVLPRANKYALERGSYNGKRGNLNRHFPPNRAPKSKLARILWKAVTSVGPDTVLDLHSSEGVYRRSPDGVGQAVFRSHSRQAAKRSSKAISATNKAFGLSKSRRFIGAPMSYDNSGPDNLFTEKTALDLGANSYLAETYRGIPLKKRTNQLTRLTRELLSQTGVLGSP